MTACVYLTSTSFDPEPLLDGYKQELLAGRLEQLLICISYPFESYWLADKPRTTLTGLYCLSTDALGGLNIVFSVCDDPALFKEIVANSTETKLSDLFQKVLFQLALPVFNTHDLLYLVSVNIAKPWGQEIWYTGVEQRGVAEMSDGNYQLPIPWVLSALPNALCANRQQDLILLKILDPLTEEVFGDLYFEVHQQKREVYVVTAVNELAWPNGQGGIRFGFDQTLRAQYNDDLDFRSAFVAAVKNYEQIRRSIDNQIDELRLRDGIGINAPVSANVLKGWHFELPQALRDEEQRLRLEMDQFIHIQPLQIGDVIKVPCLMPHSLQHGVRTIEFQTPVYERLIVAFTQKVLTQSQWDIDQAAEIMCLDPPASQGRDCLVDSAQLIVERIVDFEDFEVMRITLGPDAAYRMTSPPEYSLLIVVNGRLGLGEKSLNPEQAALVPFSWLEREIYNTSTSDSCFLLAFPKTRLILSN
jgi:hypothetical protein